MAGGSIPHFQNDAGHPAIDIGVREFMCTGANPPLSAIGRNGWLRKKKTIERTEPIISSPRCKHERPLKTAPIRWQRERSDSWPSATGDWSGWPQTHVKASQKRG